MIHLICLGNPLHADDGFGAVMAHRLSRLDWPDKVRVMDGTGKASPVALFENCRRAIVIESVPRRLGASGEIVRLDGETYQGHPPDQFSGGTGSVLAAVRRQVTPLPAIEVIGPVACNRLPFAPGLSPLTMAAALSLTAMLAAEFGGKTNSGRRLTA
ncbi:MAG: hydrogenase maturation protease [Bacteroidota bacterium]